MSRTAQRRVRALKILLVAVVFAVLPAFATSGYLLRVFTLMVAFALFALSLNVAFGHTDQLFLFVGAVAGIGGYTTVIVANMLGVTPWLLIPLGVVLAGAVGALVSYIGAKRRFTVILIAVFTLTIELAINQFFVGARSLTGGTTGLRVEGLGLESDMVFYFLFVAVLVAYALLYDRLIHSRFGLAFDAIRQDELAAESIGVDVVRYKTIAGALAAMMIGLAGVLYGFYEGRMYPSTYSFNNIDVAILIMLTLGGMRTLIGPIFGAIFIFWVEEQLAGYSDWRLVVFGVLLIVLFLYFRDGIVPRVGELLAERDLDPESLVDRYT